MIRFGALGLAALLIALPAAGLDFKQVKRLTSSDPRNGDQFGSAVAVGEGVIAVGAYLSNAKAGAVHFFRRDAQGRWEEKPFKKLTGEPGEWFGFDVAFDAKGTMLVVGAPNPGKTGKVYIYDLDKRTLVSVSGGAAGDEFGSAVAFDDGWVAVGARGAEQRAGRVYVFSVKEEVKKPKLLEFGPSQPSVGSELGQSVSLRGTVLVAGAPLPGKDGGSPGAVYRSTFEGQWGTLERLTAPGLEARAAFGYGVAVQNGKVVGGAPLANPGGAAYLDCESACRPISSLPARAGDQAGVAVAAGDGRVVIGARGAKGGNGAAYLFNDNGSFLQSLTPLVEAPRAEFGFGVAIRGLTIVVGAFREGGTGAAYVFEPSTEPSMTLSFERTELVEAREGTTVSVSVILTASEPLQARMTATLAAIPGSAQPGRDYHLPAPVLLEFAEESKSGARQQVEIPILCDAVRDGKEKFTLKLSDSSGKELDSLEVGILDSTQFGLVVDPATPPLLITRESGTSVNFSLRLACEPISEVQIELRSDGTEGRLADHPNDVPAEALTLSFTADDWNKNRRVIVKGVPDASCDGDQTYAVEIMPKTEDPQYKDVSESVLLTNLDEDVCVTATDSACIAADDVVVYTVTVSKLGPGPLMDVAGNEYVFELPDEVRVATATADRGVATVDYLENTVAWNGSLPPGGVAEIEILAPLEPVPFSPEATLAFDPCSPP